MQPAAHAEAERAATWYESQRADLGVEYLLELDLAIERAAENPHGYAMQYREVASRTSAPIPICRLLRIRGGDSQGICDSTSASRSIDVAVASAIPPHNNALQTDVAKCHGPCMRKAGATCHAAERNVGRCKERQCTNRSTINGAKVLPAVRCSGWIVIPKYPGCGLRLKGRR